MTAIADMPAAHADERRLVRVVTAFALSITCHAAALAVARGWRLDVAPAPRPIVVTLERGGGEQPAVAGADAAEAVGPLTPPAAPPAPVPVAARAPQVAVAPVRRPAVPMPERPSRPARAAPAAHALLADAPRADASRADASLAAAALGAAAVAGDPADASGSGVVASAPGGSGAGRAAATSGTSAGAGAGAGSGIDGLRALCRSCPTPEYPGRARRQGWQGTVDVALAIGSDGGVADARVDRSSGYPTLDDVALDVARRSRFTVPAGGAGVRGTLRYRFVLDAAAAQR